MEKSAREWNGEPWPIENPEPEVPVEPEVRVETEAPALLPEMILYIMEVGGYETLKSMALTNVYYREYVKRKFDHEVEYALQILKMSPGKTPKDKRRFIEKLYHLNSNMNADPHGITIVKNARTVSLTKTVNGQVNSINIKYKNKVRVSEEWTLNGKRSRIDGPAYWDRDGNIEWVRDGILHRIGGPAKRSSNIEFSEEIWAVKGKYHRIDGPAVQRWSHGNKTVEEWYHDGKLHREGAPAQMHWVWPTSPYQRSRLDVAYYNMGMLYNPLR